MFVNKVGPYFNPQETYHYYSLPVCRPERVGTRHVHTVDLITRLLALRVPLLQIHHASLTLGEVLAGDRKAISDYSIGFKESFDRKELCGVELAGEAVERLKEAIEDLYYFEFVFGRRQNARGAGGGETRGAGRGGMGRPELGEGGGGGEGG